MKALVTGGTGVVGTAAITELLRRGHQVRILSRGAADAPAEWDRPVEAFPADIGDAARVRGAAEGCGAVIHISGIVEETPPELTFERINVQGTQHIVDEAMRAHARRLIFVSSLGADRGESAYHRSKVRAEEIVRTFRGSWTIVRSGAVLGPGDETVSVLLRMVRTLPAVPVIGGGDQPFQPVWHRDLACALADCLDRSDVAGRILHIAGGEAITVREVIDLFSEVTDRSPLRVPLPAFLARIGSRLAAAVGIDAPVSAATVQMLLEGNYLRDDESNDLTGLLGYEPAPLRRRLIELVDALPEQTPEQGVGKLKRRRFTADIHDSPLTATQLLERFRTGFADIVPFEAVAEPGASSLLRLDATLTLGLPARGHVQVRVEQLDDNVITLATLEGHPLAGVVRFRFEDREPRVIRFTTDVIERPASRLDQITMAVFGSFAQSQAWKQTAENVAREADGRVPEGVCEESWELDDEQAAPLEDWIRTLVQRRRRATENRT
ncbi:MAG TPA: NAD-dependent epimerase/dehydratase family protein [Longimicrobiales bacterium]